MSQESFEILKCDTIKRCIAVALRYDACEEVNYTSFGCYLTSSSVEHNDYFCIFVYVL